jgi:hypothetical protein
MESAMTIVSIEGIIMEVVRVVVMYTVILSYRLPFSQVVLTYAGLALLSAVLVKLISPKIQIGEQTHSMDARTVSRQALSILSTAMLDLLFGIVAFIAILVIASYRFSFVEILGMLVAGWATGIVANGVLAIL